jgi:hypothetical protein
MFMGKRRQYIIKKEFQYPFIAAFSMVCIAGIAMAVAAMHHTMGMGLEHGMYRGHIPVTGTAQIVVPIAVKTNLLFVLAGAVVLGFVSYYFGRKTQLMVDGFKEGLEMLRDGRFDFVFDDEDSSHYFPELEAAFNTMVVDNRARLHDMKAIADGLDIPLGALRATKGAEMEPAAKAIDELCSGVEELSSAMGRFKL